MLLGLQRSVSLHFLSFFTGYPFHKMNSAIEVVCDAAHSFHVYTDVFILMLHI